MQEKIEKVFQGVFFRKFCLSIWLVLKSGLLLRAGCDGARTVITSILYMVISMTTDKRLRLWVNK